LLVAIGIGAGLPAAGQEAEPSEPTGSGEDEAILLPEAYLDGYGWFNKAQQVPTGGKPAPNPPSCPSSPASECTVGPPPDGLYVAYDTDAVVPGTVTGPVSNAPTLPTPPAPPSPAPAVSSTPQPIGPTAYSAVRYAVPEGADSQLTLGILSRSTTTPGGTDPTVGKLFACISTTPGWLAAQNARYDEGPKYDCTTADEGDIQGDVVAFDLGPQFVQGGMLDVAIVPAGDVPSGDRPFQMSLAAPTDDSLVLVNAAELGEMAGLLSEDELVFEDPAATFFEDLAVEDLGVVEDIVIDPSTSFDAFGQTATAPVARPSVRRPQLAVPAGNVANPFRRDASRGERTMAVAILLAIGVGLWWLGGRPIRPPRLLGSLGSAAAPEPSGEIMTGGIGRFARPRTSRPPRLF
jgi:hypothetical protein